MKGAALAEVGGSVDAAAGEFITGWYIILVMAILSVAIGFIFLVLLKIFVGYIIWGSIIAVELLLVAGGAYLFAIQGTCEGENINSSLNSTLSNVAAGAANGTADAAADVANPDAVETKCAALTPP